VRIARPVRRGGPGKRPGENPEPRPGSTPYCQQPAAACDVHHVVWRVRGGRTQLINLVLLCRFHHLIAIHQWGWTITLHPDATVTAVSPDGRRTLHSHSPPGTAAA
jgi:hypothetical protein